jgi:(2Fe-2S) ferredoxin
MSSRKKRKKKLKKLMRKRDLKRSLAVVVCVGKKCCPRRIARALVDEMRTYAEEAHPHVRVEAVGCLHVCKKGPIAATYPDIEFHKRVDADDARALIDDVADD